jgi:flagellin
MAISINTNMAATRASHFLASNHANLQRSLDRLSSGKRITQPADDAGGLAVAMKLNHSINGLRGASSNISNAISFLQVQDGILQSAGDIVSRIGELKGMYSDVTKQQSDKDLYETEFTDLKNQLTAIAGSEFNGIALFANTTTLRVYLDENGSTASSMDLSSPDLVGGTEMSTLMLAAGTLNPTPVAPATTEVSQDDITAALEEIASLRATNGGEARRLQYAQADVETKISNMTAAHGRIMDVDIAAESSNLARQQILVQASAAMTAQANTSNDVALMLLQ